MKVTDERRNFFRLAVEIPVGIMMQNQSKFYEQMFVSGVIRNLSGGGMLIDTDVSISQQKPLQLQFTLPVNETGMSEQDFSIKAQVVRLHKKNQKKYSTYGVQFVDILPGIQDRIVKFLFDLQIASRYHLENCESKKKKDSHATRKD
ncbi:MAG: PilZ domain-containing protein [Candidatus Auribacterota bacterium]|jgi:c-di-GMP-binding flagellar brake protein YcgR|nr:PilZ domain-containing protein [Candidatus Auribacterota bacterium]